MWSERVCQPVKTVLKSAWFCGGLMITFTCGPRLVLPSVPHVPPKLGPQYGTPYDLSNVEAGNLICPDAVLVCVGDNLKLDSSN